MKLLYDKKMMAGQSIEDYIAHEMAHIIPFPNCISATDYNELNEEIKSMYVEGISNTRIRKKMEENHWQKRLFGIEMTNTFQKKVWN